MRAAAGEALVVFSTVYVFARRGTGGWTRSAAAAMKRIVRPDPPAVISIKDGAQSAI